MATLSPLTQHHATRSQVVSTLSQHLDEPSCTHTLTSTLSKTRLFPTQVSTTIMRLRLHVKNIANILSQACSVLDKVLPTESSSDSSHLPTIEVLSTLNTKLPCESHPHHHALPELVSLFLRMVLPTFDALAAGSISHLTQTMLPNISNCMARTSLDLNDGRSPVIFLGILNWTTF